MHGRSRLSAALLRRVAPLLGAGPRVAGASLEGLPTASHHQNTVWCTAAGPVRPVATQASVRKPVRVRASEESPFFDKVPFRYIKAVKRVRQAGFECYFVGGSVRDLLMKKEPKDYDIITLADPSMVQKIFRKAGDRVNLVGKRFRIALVEQKQGVLEVSSLTSNIHNTPKLAKTLQEEGWTTVGLDHLRKRTNRKADYKARTAKTVAEEKTLLQFAWKENVECRDFTINALMYDPHTGLITDFAGGLEDLRSGFVRTVSNTADSLAEDPARMVRGVRVAGRTGFTVCEEVKAFSVKNAKLLSGLDRSRLTGELNSLLCYGYAAPSLKLMIEFGLVHELLPMISQFFSMASDLVDAAGGHNDPGHSGEVAAGGQGRLVLALLRRIDKHASLQEPVRPALIFAGLLIPCLSHRMGVSSAEILKHAEMALTDRKSESAVAFHGALTSLIREMQQTPLVEGGTLRLIGRNVVAEALDMFCSPSRQESPVKVSRRTKQLGQSIRQDAAILAGVVKAMQLCEWHDTCRKEDNVPFPLDAWLAHLDSVDSTAPNGDFEVHDTEEAEEIRSI
mmetsp:Transcript_13523/g.49197  ORF Transcript_13523/g.49197 Transcript_13523/m.49197 type:complete len:565 (-) Transcript_13523:71-1765(-)